MCKKTNYKISNPRIDKCMKTVIFNLNYFLRKGFKTVACCCGHKKYPPTILIKNSYNVIFDLFSGKVIPRKRRFYKRDKQGYYYIPEVINATH